MSSDEGDLSCTDVFDAPPLRGAGFSVTSIQAVSSFSNDNDHRGTGMGQEWAGPRPGASFVPCLCAIEHLPSCP